MKQTIGITYDLRKDYLNMGLTEDQIAEFDSEETINAIHQTIQSCGYSVQRIGNAWALCKMLAAGHKWDMVFNIAEGLSGRCRESQVPAILELYNIPYTFSDPLVCAVTLDKAFAKKIVMLESIPTPPFAVIENIDQLDSVDLGWPLFAKPLAEGTGKGIDQNSVIKNQQQLFEVCSEILGKYDQPVIIEQFLPGREFTVAILGTGPQAAVLGTMEIEMVDRENTAVYSLLNKEQCESRVIYRPLPGTDRLKDQIEKVALDSYRALQCRDAGRVDIRCDKNNQPSFIELNPLPGLHPTHSDLPMIATQEAMSYQTLIGTIIENAFARTQSQQDALWKQS